MLFDAPTNLAAITGKEATRDRKLFFGLSVLSTVVQAAALVTLIPVLEHLFSDNPRSALSWVSLLVLLMGIAWGVDVAAFRIGFGLGCRILNTIETHGVSAIRRMDLADTQSEKASKLAKLVSTAGAESLSTVVHLIFPLIQGIMITPLLSIFLLGISWKLALVALITGILLLGALISSEKLIAHSEKNYADIMRELNDASFEFAWAQPTLRTAGVSGSALDGLLRQSCKRGLRLLLWQIPGETIFSITSQLGLLAFAVMTGKLYLDGEISGITAAGLVIILLRIIEAAGTLSLLATPLSAANRTFADIRDLIHKSVHPAPPAPYSSAPFAVHLENVSYRYPNTQVGIHDVNLTLDAGSITVIVGESGSGKSTLLDVLAGLRERTSGGIFFDGIPCDAQERLARTSVMFQTTELRAGTLRDNVAASPEELAEITEQAQLTQLIDALPHGWDSTIGEGGSTLSGGERQRVGLARALAKATGLLLVDEATSALDATNERAIVHALEGLRGQRTMVIVTHRPALVSIADQVIVLKDGVIAEQGGVTELINRDGHFTDLWERWKDVEQWTV